MQMKRQRSHGNKGDPREQQGPAAAAQVRGAAATSLLAPRRGLASAECKPGKAPKNVDYVGEPSRHVNKKRLPVDFLLKVGRARF